MPYIGTGDKNTIFFIYTLLKFRNGNIHVFVVLCIYKSKFVLLHYSKNEQMVNILFICIIHIYMTHMYKKAMML